MNTKTTLPISEVRKRIFKLAEEVQKPNIHYTLTKKGKPKAVIISAEEFESWMETLEIMRNPRLMREIESAREDFKKGEYVTLEELLGEEGLLTIKKPKKHVSSSSQKIRKKKSKKDKQAL